MGQLFPGGRGCMDIAGGMPLSPDKPEIMGGYMFFSHRVK
jgi:hypothetical protein